MKKYISYSEYSLFYRDRGDYYRNYILGEEMEETEAMKVGKIIHEALEKDNDWQPQLREMGWSNGQLIKARRMFDKIQPKRFGEREVGVFADLNGTRLFGVFDLYDKNAPRLADYKTTIETDSARAKWMYTQKKADFSEQFDFYALMEWLNTHRFFQEMTIYALNPMRGTCKTFKSVRDRRSIEIMARKIEDFVLELKQLGWWHKRLARKDRQNMYIQAMI